MGIRPPGKTTFRCMGHPPWARNLCNGPFASLSYRVDKDIDSLAPDDDYDDDDVADALTVHRQCCNSAELLESAMMV